MLGPQNSEELLQRLSVLKKYTSSVLWLSTSTRREGGTLEQVLFASAAGVSMVFATLVAFYAQSIYGQLSIPVFLVLVIAYMFKDRIKELGRAFSTHILSRRLYDYRTSIQTQDGERDLGYVREKMIHVRPQGRERTVPPEVMAARRSDPHYEPELFGRPEVVIHYAKQVTLRKDAFRYLAEDGLLISAINDITRLDIRSFLRKMDNPYEERLMLRDGKVERVRCQRTYPLNLISVFGTEDGATTCERTLVVLNRKGIVRIEQFEGAGSAPQSGGTLAGTLNRMAQHRLQLLGRAAAWVTQVDFMVQVMQPVTLLLGKGAHAVEGGRFLAVGAKMHDLDGRPFFKAPEL